MVNSDRDKSPGKRLRNAEPTTVLVMLEDNSVSEDELRQLYDGEETFGQLYTTPSLDFGGNLAGSAQERMSAAVSMAWLQHPNAPTWWLEQWWAGRSSRTRHLHVAILANVNVPDRIKNEVQQGGAAGLAWAEDLLGLKDDPLPEPLDFSEVQQRAVRAVQVAKELVLSKVRSGPASQEALDAFFADLKAEGPLYRQWNDAGRIRKVFDPQILERINTLKAIASYEDFLAAPHFQQEPIFILNLVDAPHVLVEELATVYPLLEKVSRGHDFDFAYVDAELKIVGAWGLGRKNSLFEEISEDGKTFSSNSEDVAKRLDERCPCPMYTTLRNTLSELGDLYFERDHDNSRESIEDALMAGPEEDGVYIWKDDGWDEEELRGMLDVTEFDKDIEAFESVFRSYFPALETLNTYDY